MATFILAHVKRTTLHMRLRNMNEIFLQKLFQERYKSRFLGLFQSATRPHVLGSRCCYSKNLSSRPVVKNMQSTLKEKLKNAIIQAKLGGPDDRGIFVCGRRRNRRKRNKKNGQNKRRIKQTMERASSKCNSHEEVSNIEGSKWMKTKETLTNADSLSCEKFENDVAKDTTDKESLPDSGIGFEEDEDGALEDYQLASSFESLSLNLSNNTEDENKDENEEAYDEDPYDEDKDQYVRTENNEEDFRDNIVVSDILKGHEFYIGQKKSVYAGFELKDEDQKDDVECSTKCVQNTIEINNAVLAKEGETGKPDAEDFIKNDQVSPEALEDDDVVLFDREVHDVVRFDRHECMKGVGMLHSISFSYKDLLYKEQVSEEEEEEDTSDNGYQRSVTPIAKVPRKHRVTTLPPTQTLDESSPLNDTSNDKFMCCLIL